MENVRSGRWLGRHTPCSDCGTGGRRASRRASPQWLHLWLHSLAISTVREWPHLDPRPAHTAVVVTADRRVDDLESERTERNRGSNSFAPAIPERLLSSINAGQDDRLPVSVLARGCIPGCIWAAVPAAGPPLGRVRRRGWVASLVLLTNSAVVRTAHVIKRSLRGTSARLFAEGWRAVPMLLGDEGIAQRPPQDRHPTLPPHCGGSWWQTFSADKRSRSAKLQLAGTVE